jgi:ribose 5-phosphate isomerase A
MLSAPASSLRRRAMLPAMASSDPAREAAARAAVALVEPEMTLGIGSGRAVWKVVDGIAERWPDGPPLRAVAASERTAALARERGIPLVELDGSTQLDLALDGADEIDPELRLIKGGGGALLREKIVIAAAERFVVVAEASKRVERLGQGFRLPVEVVRFGWRETRRRIGSFLADAELRAGDDGEPYVTDEGHYILDCALPADVSPDELAPQLEHLPGVVEHGLFIRMAEQALLGHPDGTAEVFRPKAGWELT